MYAEFLHVMQYSNVFVVPVRSSVGAEYARCRSLVFVGVSLLLLVLSIVLIVMTHGYTASYPAIYIAYIG